MSKMRISFLLFSSSLVAILMTYLLSLQDTSILYEYELLTLSSVPFNMMIIVDKLSVSFSLIVGLISGCVFMFSSEYMNQDKYYWRFTWILLMFVLSMNMLIFSGSLFFLLLGWDGLGISSFALIIYYQSEESLSGGFQTMLANRIGDSLIVVGSLLFVVFGQFSYLYMDTTMWVLVFIFSVAAMTKSAQYPFSSWLPAAMAAPTPVSALVHSSTLVTAGIYLVIRLSYNLNLNDLTMKLLLLVSAVTCLLGGWAATYENDLKKIIALSTLSQLGVMMFCLAMGYPIMALFHLFTHALFKALLFLAAGTVLMSNYGVQDIRLLGSTTKSMPMVLVIFNITSLCLVGAPFLSAFYSKHMILELMMSSNISVVSVVIMVLATFMTAKYVFRVLKSVSMSAPTMETTCAISLIKVDYSLFILAVGAILGGKMISLMEMNVNCVILLPSAHSQMINIVTMMGILTGLFLSSKLNSVFLSSLFWLTPFFVFSTKVFSEVLRCLSVLDYGWLEPYVIMKNKLSGVGLYISESMNWPQSSSSFIRSIMVFMFLFIVYNFSF